MPSSYNRSNSSQNGLDDANDDYKTEIVSFKVSNNEIFKFFAFSSKYNEFIQPSFV